MGGMIAAITWWCHLISYHGGHTRIYAWYLILSKECALETPWTPVTLKIHSLRAMYLYKILDLIWYDIQNGNLKCTHSVDRGHIWCRAYGWHGCGHIVPHELVNNCVYLQRAAIRYENIFSVKFDVYFIKDQATPYQRNKKWNKIT